MQNEEDHTNNQDQLDNEDHDNQDPVLEDNHEGEEQVEQEEIENQQNEGEEQQSQVDNEEQAEQSPRNDPGVESQNEEFQTPENDLRNTSSAQLNDSNASPDLLQKNSDPKRQEKNFMNSSTTTGPKNFIEMNLKMKTSMSIVFQTYTEKEIQKEISERKKERLSVLSSRKSQTSWMSSRMSVIGKEETSTGLEWGKLAHRNSILDRQPNQVSYSKNMSKDYLTSAREPTSSANSLGHIYSHGRKEQAYQRTNASGINQMHSYKTLDMPEKNENGIVPQLLANVDLKQNLNLKSQLDNHNYMRQDEVPSDYNSFQPKNQIVHNLNNKIVQSMRNRTLASNIF